ncbi:tRNA lysidine(34) synthetase TilS [Roseiarcaceae bacterium H3SJ34-1]|uniref:tRNA lysidine(34) synthetase TilS n=1 Tax=Terripilifer ovatus TaxID=3032367 RepID=UPI003AB9715E|nr:tRNA lysidine(34) synthetase TilS [Roseiarcaceae bacterium H3SJ34-1]
MPSAERGAGSALDIDLDPSLIFAKWTGVAGALLAVSGGPDSLALLLMATIWSRESGTRVFAATVDHGLRPEAAEEAAYVGEIGAALGVPHAVLTWRGPHPKTRIQELAREARYRLLSEHARDVGANVLMTAHHADDQAETILFRLLHGSGVAGLAGIREETQAYGLTLARPLLHLRKPELEQVCADNNVPFISDPSNKDSQYARTRMRELTALLEAEGLGPEQWRRFARRMAGADEVLRRAVSDARAHIAKETSTDSVRLDVQRLKRQPVDVIAGVVEAEITSFLASADSIRLDRLERSAQALREALDGGRIWKGTLAGAILNLDRSGSLTIAKEGPRQRGRGPRKGN